MHTIFAVAACVSPALVALSNDYLQSDLLPAGSAEVRDGGHRQRASQQQASEAVRTTFFRCVKVSHFCDLTRNLRSVSAYESTFAHQYLSRMKFTDVQRFFKIFSDLQKHILNNGKECHNIEPPRAYMARTIKEHINEDPYNFGKLVANYVNAPDVGFKKAFDAIVDAGKTMPSQCSWTRGEVGLGKKLEELKAAVRGGKGFMWGMQKGRGDIYDKNAMLTELPKSVITAGMASHFERENKLEQKKAASDQVYEQMHRDEQQKLPRSIRWGQGFMNRYFGLFNFGDGDELHELYFYKKIVHGGGIHDRNLSEGNPAARMLDFGMPWIGGVSGSVVDFYLLAKALGLSGSELAEAVVADIACLVAGHQHSLGELLFAAAMTEVTDKSVHSKTAQMPPQREGQFKPSPNGAYFASNEMWKVVEVMNMPEAEYQKWLASTTERTQAFSMYEAAMSEFIGRAVKFEFLWKNFALPRSNNVTEKMSELLKNCLRHEEAVDDFERAVMTAGGYKEYHEDGLGIGEDNEAWDAWVGMGTNGEGDVMSFSEWLEGIMSFDAHTWVVLAETDEGNNPDAELTGLQKRETNLLELWRCLDDPEINKAFDDPPKGMNRSIFKEFYRLATYRSSLTAIENCQVTGSLG